MNIVFVANNYLKTIMIMGSGLGIGPAVFEGRRKLITSTLVLDWFLFY